jgi:hypothetical protein
MTLTCRRACHLPAPPLAVLPPRVQRRRCCTSSAERGLRRQRPALGVLRPGRVPPPQQPAREYPERSQAEQGRVHREHIADKVVACPARHHTEHQMGHREGKGDHPRPRSGDPATANRAQDKEDSERGDVDDVHPLTLAGARCPWRTVTPGVLVLGSQEIVARRRLARRCAVGEPHTVLRLVRDAAASLGARVSPKRHRSNATHCGVRLAVDDGLGYVGGEVEDDASVRQRNLPGHGPRHGPRLVQGSELPIRAATARPRAPLPDVEGVMADSSLPTLGTNWSQDRSAPALTVRRRGTSSLCAGLPCLGNRASSPRVREDAAAHGAVPEQLRAATPGGATAPRVVAAARQADHGASRRGARHGR